VSRRGSLALPALKGGPTDLPPAPRASALSVVRVNRVAPRPRLRRRKVRRRSWLRALSCRPLRGLTFGNGLVSPWVARIAHPEGRAYRSAARSAGSRASIRLRVTDVYRRQEKAGRQIVASIRPGRSTRSLSRPSTQTRSPRSGRKICRPALQGGQDGAWRSTTSVERRARGAGDRVRGSRASPRHQCRCLSATPYLTSPQARPRRKAS
jgi:hypothetical protein